MKYDGNLTAKYVVETSVIRPLSVFPWKWLPFSQPRGVHGAVIQGCCAIAVGLSLSSCQ